jgi:hypothetical protein
VTKVAVFFVAGALHAAGLTAAETVGVTIAIAVIAHVFAQAGCNS